MKTKVIVVIFSSFLSLYTFSADNRESIELLEAAQDAVDLSKALSLVGTVGLSCSYCPDREAHQKIVANKKEIIIKNPYYLKGNEPYVLRLIRNRQTPQKLKLKFKNGHRVCLKDNWAMSCLIEGYEQIDNDIEIDFTELPLSKENESEIVEIKFIKSNPKKYKYSVSAEILKDQAPKAKVSSYFFGEGYDVKFTQEK